MQSAYSPRLSEAKTLLPLLRAQLIAAAPRYSLPANISLDLLPIVEDGLFGYELVPDRNTHTYFTVGLDETGEAVLRGSLCYVGAPSTLRIAALNGESVACRNFSPQNCPPKRDSIFAEMSDAVDSALSQLLALFPERPRKAAEFQVNLHRYLDEALATAHACLSQWNPFIEFVRLPDEAQYGFDANLYEEWAVVLPDSGAPSASAKA